MPKNAVPGLAVLLVLAALAMARPLDHDESQYVAAAVLTAHGLLPYRDFAYLQAPLQPFLFAPVAVLAGAWTWPALRLVNALLGAAAIGFVWRAAQAAGAGARAATLAAGLFAATDILLFSIGTARNDALPVALLAAALVPIVHAEKRGATGWSAALAGALLAGAAAAKISYALPAMAYGIYALLDRRHRPLAILFGALPVAALVGWTFALAPENFLFGTLHFPARAPGEYYAARPWKLSLAAKAVDTAKFLALGPALLALAIVARAFGKRPRVLGCMMAAGLIAGLLPSPTWRQYLLPALPPLFVLLALVWHARPPGRAVRVAAVIFACAGIAPSLVAMAGAVQGVPLVDAMRQGSAIRAAMDRARVSAPVATLSPQFLPTTGRLPDPRFATGPFYFRSHGLLAPADDRRAAVVSGARLGALLASPPAAVLIGGEGAWTSGDEGLDDVLERWAIGHRYRRVPVGGSRFRLYVRQP